MFDNLKKQIASKREALEKLLSRPQDKIEKLEADLCRDQKLLARATALERDLENFPRAIALVEQEAATQKANLELALRKTVNAYLHHASGGLPNFREPLLEAREALLFFAVREDILTELRRRADQASIELGALQEELAD